MSEDDTYFFKGGPEPEPEKVSPIYFILAVASTVLAVVVIGDNKSNHDLIKDDVLFNLTLFAPLIFGGMSSIYYIGTYSSNLRMSNGVYAAASILIIFFYIFGYLAKQAA